MGVGRVLEDGRIGAKRLIFSQKMRFFSAGSAARMCGLKMKQKRGASS
jgi:hypothetical protein